MTSPELLKERLHGIAAISITPFKKDGKFDEDGYAKHLKFLIDNGINKENAALVITGSTGECGALKTEERKYILDMVLETVDGKLPIIAGCNSTNIYEVIELAQNAEKKGALGVMATPPYYYPPKDQECIYQFYKKLNDSINIGIFIYNNLEVVNVDIRIDILNRLKVLPNIVGIKECTPNFYKMGRVAQEIGDEVSVVNGHGEFLEPFAAIAGTTGFISSMSNFAPKWAVEIWKARSSGDYARAKEVRDKLIPYMDLAVEFSQQGGEAKVIGLLKVATNLVGSVGGYGRLPVIDFNEEEMKKVKSVFSKMGLI